MGFPYNGNRRQDKMSKGICVLICVYGQCKAEWCYVPNYRAALSFRKLSIYSNVKCTNPCPSEVNLRAECANALCNVKCGKCPHRTHIQNTQPNFLTCKNSTQRKQQHWPLAPSALHPPILTPKKCKIHLISYRRISAIGW